MTIGVVLLGEAELRVAARVVERADGGEDAAVVGQRRAGGQLGAVVDRAVRLVHGHDLATADAALVVDVVDEDLERRLLIGLFAVDELLDALVVDHDDADFDRRRGHTLSERRVGRLEHRGRRRRPRHRRSGRTSTTTEPASSSCSRTQPTTTSNPVTTSHRPGRLNRRIARALASSTLRGSALDVLVLGAAASSCPSARSSGRTPAAGTCRRSRTCPLRSDAYGPPPRFAIVAEACSRRRPSWSVFSGLPTLAATSWNSDRIWHASLMLPYVSMRLAVRTGHDVEGAGRGLARLLLVDRLAVRPVGALLVVDRAVAAGDQDARRTGFGLIPAVSSSCANIKVSETSVIKVTSGIALFTFSMNCWLATFSPATNSALTPSDFQRSKKLASCAWAAVVSLPVDIEERSGAGLHAERLQAGRDDLLHRGLARRRREHRDRLAVQRARRLQEVQQRLVLAFRAHCTDR